MKLIPLSYGGERLSEEELQARYGDKLTRLVKRTVSGGRDAAYHPPAEFARPANATPSR